MGAVYKSSLVFAALAICFGIAYSNPAAALAQFLGEASGMSITMSPSLPPPNSTIEVSLNAYSVNTAGTITWYVNGEELSESRNARSISFVVGDIGEETVVRAIVTPQNGAPLSIHKTISPAVIDLIIEADTNVPAFFKGRALPGQGSPVRITALPFNGSDGKPSSFTYTWELNRKVLFGGPVKGKSTIEISMPDYKNALLSVEVTDTDGRFIGKKNVTMSGTDPELYFYEMNPLRGQSRRAIVNSLVLLGDEITVRAEPYFINVGQEPIQHEWRLDGMLVDSAESDPQMITLRTTGGAGSADVNFQMVNLSQLTQYADDSFSILFE